MRTISSLLALVLLLAGCASDSAPVDSVDERLDSDGDGVPDLLEKKYGSDPFNATSLPDLSVQEDVDFSGSGMIIGGNELLGLQGTCGGRVAQDTARFTWLIEAPQNATDVHVAGLTFTASYPNTMPEGDIYVFNPDGQLITGSTTMTIPPGSADWVTAEGKHPAGEYRIEVRGCLGAGSVHIAAAGVLVYVPDINTLL